MDRRNPHLRSRPTSLVQRCRCWGARTRTWTWRVKAARPALGPLPTGHPPGEGRAGGMSDALVVEDLAEGVADLDEVGLVGHHLVDVLVGGRDLVDEGLGPVRQPRPV